MREDRGLSGEFIEGRKVEAGKAALVELLVGEFVEQKPDDARMGVRWRCGELRFVQSRSWIEVAGLPAAPDELPEDEQAGKGEDAEKGGSGALDCFKARKKFFPEDGDRDESEKSRQRRRSM